MRIRIVDAFTDRPFSGNPAGVVLLDAANTGGAVGRDGSHPTGDHPGFPDDAWLQHVAAEVNLAETAFAHPLPEGADADWALRWFTPATEVDMCGHATLATAHVLHTTGTATGTVRFRTRSGILITTADDSGAITMDFPTAELTPVPVPQVVADALGVEILSAYDTGENVGDLLVELPDEKSVRALDPDLRALAGHGGRGVIATARAEDPAGGHDFVSRCFFPAVGIDEDTVTGSAHTALAPFWSARLGRDDLTGLQGTAKRKGTVRTGLRGDRTLLTGTAVTVIDGELHAPVPDALPSPVPSARP
ncbi:PhzF family phenazine biosynthesis protein [Streptomyces sp. NPDC003077]|uniref:PhzF family phenazine biosynthesis protein n=1 Tax=Streptomyces sp. NPDC003077 TaxID=3154443 RepID=UPI0033A55527